MIKELSRTRLLWDSLILALILISCVMVPYQFAFNQGSALSGFQIISSLPIYF
jgi:phosphate starvation-inducible membrane PsiE